MNGAPRRERLPEILRLDAAANALAGLTLMVAGGWLATPLGLGSAWAILDPTSADTWMRWAMVGVADLSAASGIAKLLGLRSLSAGASAGG